MSGSSAHYVRSKPWLAQVVVWCMMSECIQMKVLPHLKAPPVVVVWLQFMAAAAPIRLWPLATGATLWTQIPRLKWCIGSFCWAETNSGEWKCWLVVSSVPVVALLWETNTLLLGWVGERCVMVLCGLQRELPQLLCIKCPIAKCYSRSWAST